MGFAEGRNGNLWLRRHHSDLRGERLCEYTRIWSVICCHTAASSSARSCVSGEPRFALMHSWLRGQTGSVHHTSTYLTAVQQGERRDEPQMRTDETFAQAAGRPSNTRRRIALGLVSTAQHPKHQHRREREFTGLQAWQAWQAWPGVGCLRVPETEFRN